VKLPTQIFVFALLKRLEDALGTLCLRTPHPSLPLRLDSFEEKDKKKVSSVPNIAKAIVVSISADAKQRLLDDTLK